MIPIRRNTNDIILTAQERPSATGAQEAYLTSPILRRYELSGFIDQEFILTPMEESVLFETAYKASLPPGLPLIHILFFRLSHIVGTFESSMTPESFKVLREAIQRDYGEFIKDGHLTLGNFLQVLSQNTDTDLRNKSSELANTLSLMNRFIESPQTHRMLTEAPHETLVGFERAYTTLDITTVCQNCVAFSELYFSSCLTLEEQERMSLPIKAFLVGVQGLNCQTAGDLKINYPIFLKAGIEMASLNSSLTIPMVLCEDFAVLFKKRINPENHFTPLEEARLLSGKTVQRQILDRAYDKDDPLSVLKANGYVSYDCHLSQREREVLSSVMSEITLDLQMPLSSLLFIAIFKRLDDLAHNNPFEQILKDVQKEFAGIYIQYFIGEAIQTLKEMQTTLSIYPGHEICFLSISDLARRLDLQIESLKQKLESKVIRGSKKQIDLFVQKRQALVEKIEKRFIPIVDLIKKLISFLPPEAVREEKKISLLAAELRMIPGFELIDDAPLNPSMLKLYYRFIKLGFELLTQRKQIIIQFDFARHITDVTKISNQPTEQQYKKLAQNLVDCVNIWSGLLTVSHGVDPDLRKATALSFQMFIISIFRLSQRHLLPKGSLTIDSSMRRFIYNAKEYRSKKTDIIAPSDPRLQKARSMIEQQIKSWNELLDFVIENETVMSYLSNLNIWHQKCQNYKDSIETCFKEVTVQLVQLKRQLIQEYQSALELLSYDDLQQVNVQETKERLFKEALCLVRPLMMVFDMQAILLNRRFSEEAEIIPYELADIMQLDELDQVLEKLLAKKAPQVGQQIVETKESTAAPDAEETPRQPKKPKNSRFRPAPAPAAVVKAQLVERPLEPTPLRDLRKSRHVLAWLHQHGFMEARQRGSHHILQNEAGAQVVVPNNSNLPLGTLKSIEGQFKSARNSNVNEE